MLDASEAMELEEGASDKHESSELARRRRIADRPVLRIKSYLD